MIIKHNCVCLSCGRAYELALDSSEEFGERQCPVCGAAGLVKAQPRNFLESMFRSGGG